jgi:hypothetical protein
VAAIGGNSEAIAMVGIRNATARIVLLAVLISGLTIRASFASGFMDEVKRNHSNIFVVTVLSGNLISADRVNACFYKYTAKVTQNLYGGYEKQQFVFYSESHLAMGESYLLFYDREFSKTYRPLTIAAVESGHRAGSDSDGACAKLLAGPFLVYDEIHLIAKIWNGRMLEKAVEFNDPSMSFSASVIRTLNTQFVTFDAIKAQLEN